MNIEHIKRRVKEMGGSRSDIGTILDCEQHICRILEKLGFVLEECGEPVYIDQVAIHSVLKERNRALYWVINRLFPIRYYDKRSDGSLEFKYLIKNIDNLELPNDTSWYNPNTIEICTRVSIYPASDEILKYRMVVIDYWGDDMLPKIIDMAKDAESFEEVLLEMLSETEGMDEFKVEIRNKTILKILD